MNIVVEMVDRYKIPKNHIRKEVGVAWYTVHMWYRGVIKPNEAHQEALGKMFDRVTNGVGYGKS